MGAVRFAVRLTRAHLVSLDACSEGLAEFDRRFPSGVFEATDEADLRRLTDYVCNDWIEWLGPLAVRGYGDGSGDGSGYGSGYGSGDGSGYGSGYGDGYGDGYGYGDGCGDGSGYGSGYGDGRSPGGST